MNDNSMSNVCCSTKDTIRGLMSDLMEESQYLKNSINDIHDIMLGSPPPVDGRLINVDESKSLESAISIVLNTIRSCNDIASHILNKL